jgi:ABC-type multidrug transport system fused ATPase/permease subunit
LDPRLVATAKNTKTGGRKDSRRMSAMPSINIEETKEVDPVAKAKMIEAQKLRKAENSQINQDLDDLIDPNK